MLLQANLCPRHILIAKRNHGSLNQMVFTKNIQPCCFITPAGEINLTHGNQTSEARRARTDRCFLSAQSARFQREEGSMDYAQPLTKAKALSEPERPWKARDNSDFINRYQLLCFEESTDAKCQGTTLLIQTVLKVCLQSSDTNANDWAFSIFPFYFWKFLPLKMRADEKRS